MLILNYGKDDTMKLVVKKDIYLNKYIVWEIHRNWEYSRYIGLRKDCIKWLKKHDHS